MSSSLPTHRWTRPPAARLSDAQFARITRTLGEQTGILFPEEKRREFEIKLSNMLVRLEPQKRRELLDKAATSPAAMQKLVNQLTVGESYFFRNRPHFDALTEVMFPELIEQRAKQRSLRIWSAGCATGEEPFSIAILLREQFPQVRDWEITIIATDINTAFLERAREATYSSWSFRGVEQELIDKYFTRAPSGRFRLDDRIVSSVQFRRYNLAERPHAGRVAQLPFDLVLCRNVLIYFAFDFADQVVESIIETLAIGGYLLVGHAEAFPALGNLQANFSNATYYYRRNQASSRAAMTLPPGRTLAIPGIGVGTLHPPPPTFVSLAPPGTAPGSSGPFALRSTFSEIPTRQELLVAMDLERAQSLADAGEVEEALRVLGELATGDGELEPQVYFLQALVSDQAGNVDQAIQAVKKAIFLDKEFTVAHYFHGVIREREGDGKAAARCFRNVIKLIDRYPEDHEIDASGGLTVGRLRAITTERIRELGRK